MAKQRAIVYIDGFNLYFGLKSSVKQTGRHRLTKRSYWLDVQKLAESIAKHAELAAVKYFTARIKGNYHKQLRQNAFLNAIQTHCPKLQIFEGRFLLRRVFCSRCRTYSKQFICPSCQSQNIYPEEKKSDVNIATQMLLDAHENRFDIAYLVSCDSDFVPPIKAICCMNPPKTVAVAFPPGQGRSKELEDAANFSFFISTSGIKKSWLPESIEKPDGTFIVIPDEWKE